MPSRRHSVGSRGLSRFEVTIVVGLLGVVGGGIGFYASSASAGTDAKTAETNARTIAGTADDWRQQHNDVGCPTVSRLVEDEKLDGARAEDPWGGRYRIECHDSETKVRSPGPDGKLRTEDDVVVSRG